MSNPTDQWLRDNGGASYPAVSFEHIGAVIVGRVIDEPRIVETSMDGTAQTSYVVGVEVLQGTIITIGKVGERRPAAVGDEASIWFKRGNMASELTSALTRAGAQGIAVGGTIAVKYIGDGPRSPGKNPPKQYQVQYVAPVVQIGLGDLIPGGGAQPNIGQGGNGDSFGVTAPTPAPLF